MVNIADWAADHNGQSLDFDGAYGAQCVDLAQFWAQALGTHTFWGNAIDIINQGNDGDYVTIHNQPDNFPAPGDIVVWAANDANIGTGPYGHVDICLSADVNHLTTFDQNWVEVPAHAVTHRNYEGVVGWLHPRVLDAPTPQPQAPETPAPVEPSQPDSAPAPQPSEPADAPSNPVPPVSSDAQTPTSETDQTSTPPSSPEPTPTPVVNQPQNKGVRNKKMTIPARLRSRKFWIAVVTVAGFCLHGDINQAVAVILGYFGAQGYVDAQSTN